MKSVLTENENRFLALLAEIPRELEHERKQPFTSSELKEVQRILKDFGIKKDVFENVPKNIRTYGELHKWKYMLITDILEKYAG